MVINVTQAVYAIPLIAIAVVVGRLALRRRAASADGFAPSGYRRRGSPITAVVVGAGGLLFGAAMFVNADADFQAYRSSPACQAGLVLAAPLDGTCTVSSATIESSYVSGGRGSSTHVVLGFPDGRNVDVIETAVRQGSPVRGFREANDTNAAVQRFRGRVVLVRTLSGSFETADMPYRRMLLWGMMGIALGGAGVLAAILATFAPSLYTRTSR